MICGFWYSEPVKPWVYCSIKIRTWRPQPRIKPPPLKTGNPQPLVNTTVNTTAPCTQVISLSAAVSRTIQKILHLDPRRYAALSHRPPEGCRRRVQLLLPIGIVCIWGAIEPSARPAYVHLVPCVYADVCLRYESFLKLPLPCTAFAKKTMTTSRGIRNLGVWKRCFLAVEL